MWKYFENVEKPQQRKRKTDEEKLQARREHDFSKRPARCFQQSWLSNKEFMQAVASI